MNKDNHPPFDLEPETAAPEAAAQTRAAKPAPAVNRSGRPTRRASRITAFQILYGLRFAEILLAAGVVATTRKTRGDDIDAACGQLAGQVLDKTKRTARRVIDLREVRAR